MTKYSCATRGRRKTLRIGYTTAFAHAANGHLGLALRTQPAGALLALLSAAAALVSGFATFSGASLKPLVMILWQPRAIVLGGGIALAAWLYKSLSLYGLM